MDEVLEWRLLPDSSEVRDGELWIGGCCVKSLTDQFGTPLYIYDESTLRNAAARTRAAFAPLGALVSYAAKACALGGVLRVFREEGLNLDIVSEGEAEAGRRAGFQPQQMHLHGNAKSDAEVRLLRDGTVHTAVIDSIDEIQRLDEAASTSQRREIWLRLCLPLEAETHDHLQTSGRGSKFGVQTENGDMATAVERLGRARHLRLTGLHVHLGSQIDDADLFARTGAELVRQAQCLRTRGFDELRRLSVGGGWKVPYLPGDVDLKPEHVAAAIQGPFASEPSFKPAVEPGRALVARAAVAIYRTMAVKSGDGRRTVCVDGGMGDNPRPPLYGARYGALAPARLDQESSGPADVAGRYCESGDYLARGVSLPHVTRGDLIAIPVSGAYQLAMASTYNLVPVPAAVMVADGTARLLSRRGTVDDLFCREPDGMW